MSEVPISGKNLCNPRNPWSFVGAATGIVSIPQSCTDKLNSY